MNHQYLSASHRNLHITLLVGTRSVLAGLADASIKGRWEFGSKRGALLIMAKPRSSYIPQTLLRLLIDIPALKDKSIVTEVISCPAYSLYLSSASKCYCAPDTEQLIA